MLAESAHGICRPGARRIEQRRIERVGQPLDHFGCVAPDQPQPRGAAGHLVGAAA
jgi:hypothetical protein